jgi:AraC-like DNA-binding protein
MDGPESPRLETFNNDRGIYTSFVSRYAGRHTIAPHFHPRLELVVFSAVGGEIRVGSHQRSIVDNHCYIIGMDAIHSYELVPREPSHAAWVLVVDLEAIALSLASYGTGVRHGLLDVFSGLELAIDREGELTRLVKSVAEGKVGRPHTPEAALLELSDLFRAVQLALGVARPRDVPFQSHGAGPAAYPVIRKVISFIRDNYHEALTLDGIAEYCAVSKYHLCRLFKTVTGYTIGGYLGQVRIDRACALLAAGSSVTQACNESGFGNLSHFIQVFRTHTGRSPGAWVRGRDAAVSGIL